MARPRPLPSNSCGVPVLASRMVWRMTSCRAGDVPTPESETRTRRVARPASSASSRPTCTRTKPTLVNFTALPSRFTSTCRRRAGSAMILDGQPHVLIPHDVEVLLVRADGDGAEGVVHHRGQVEWHVLHFDPAGLDARQVHHVVHHRDDGLGRTADGLEIVPLGRRERRVERQLRHAQHAVHRRADLVAHRRHELALEAVGALGAVLGLAQFRRALRHCLFEFVAMALQVPVAGRQVREHAVEGPHQHAHLVVGHPLGKATSKRSVRITSSAATDSWRSGLTRGRWRAAPST